MNNITCGAINWVINEAHLYSWIHKTHTHIHSHTKRKKGRTFWGGKKRSTFEWIELSCWIYGEHLYLLQQQRIIITHTHTHKIKKSFRVHRIQGCCRSFFFRLFSAVSCAVHSMCQYDSQFLNDAIQFQGVIHIIFVFVFAERCAKSQCIQRSNAQHDLMDFRLQQR